MVEVPQNSRSYFTVSSETPPTLKARSRIYTPQEQGGPVIPPGTGFPFIASYDSQGNSGGILNSLFFLLMLSRLMPSVDTSDVLID
jgi:hypothetical protein